MNFDSSLYQPVVTPDSLAGFWVPQEDLKCMRVVLEATTYLDQSRAPGALESGLLLEPTHVQWMCGQLDQSAAEAGVTDGSGLLHIYPAQEVSGYIQFLGHPEQRRLLEAGRARMTAAQVASEYSMIPQPSPWPRVARFGAWMRGKADNFDQLQAVLDQMGTAVAKAATLTAELHRAQVAVGIAAARNIGGLIQVADTTGLEETLARRLKPEA